MTWSLTVHEARPGHELQFASMIESGVSQARGIYAFNSANVEGWALYAEAVMKEYLPLEILRQAVLDEFVPAQSVNAGP
jgi:hypothetical protein